MGTWKKYFRKCYEVCDVSDPRATVFINAGETDFPGQFYFHVPPLFRPQKHSKALLDLMTFSNENQ